MHTIGMKNVVKKVKKVAGGKMKDDGKVWFKELRDKRMLFLYKPFEISIIFSFYLLERSTKVHLYYSMKNCGGSPDRLREMILKIVKQYQVQFTRKYIAFFN